MHIIKILVLQLVFVWACSAIPQFPAGGTQTACSSNQRCVPSNLCGADGKIITDGSGLWDPRIALTISMNCPASSKCCNIPRVTPSNICTANQECVPFYQCSKTGTIITDGAGLWTIKNNCGGTNTCCNKKQQPAGQCGVRNGVSLVRVEGGDDTQFGEFPWMAIIYRRDNDAFVCGASLIDKKKLVTAAHCVDGILPSNLKIRLGEWQINNADEELHTVSEAVARISIHPKFNSSAKNFHNDIAVIHLQNEIEYQYHINSICLPSSGQTFSGQRCIATGWGKDSFIGGAQQKLRKVEVPIVRDDQCQRRLRSTRLGQHFILDNSFMCAGGKENIDTCVGDGGGPLACEDPTGRYVLAGITAVGIDCGKKDVPGVYADVKHLLSFVQNS